MKPNTEAPNNLTIRPAEKRDINDIYTLLRDQATYHQLIHEFVATEDDIKNAILGVNPKVYCDTALVEGGVVGIAIWYYTYSTFSGQAGIHLEDLFISRKHRGGRVMRALMHNLARRAKAESLCRVEWITHTSNKVASMCAMGLGADPLSDWMPWRWGIDKMTGEQESSAGFRAFKNNLKAPPTGLIRHQP